MVNQQNSGLATMETDQILDLFNLSSESQLDSSTTLDTTSTAKTNGTTTAGDGREEDSMLDVATGEVKEKGKKGWLDGVGDLVADEAVYEREYDLEGFVRGLRVEN